MFNFSLDPPSTIQIARSPKWPSIRVLPFPPAAPHTCCHLHNRSPNVWKRYLDPTTTPPSHSLALSQVMQSPSPHRWTPSFNSICTTKRRMVNHALFKLQPVPTLQLTASLGYRSSKKWSALSTLWTMFLNARPLTALHSPLNSDKHPIMSQWLHILQYTHPTACILKSFVS